TQCIPIALHQNSILVAPRRGCAAVQTFHLSSVEEGKRRTTPVSVKKYVVFTESDIGTLRLVEQGGESIHDRGVGAANNVDVHARLQPLVLGPILAIGGARTIDQEKLDVVVQQRLDRLPRQLDPVLGHEGEGKSLGHFFPALSCTTFSATNSGCLCFMCRD